MDTRTLLLFLFLTCFINSFAVAQTILLRENFSDGNFTENPTWIDADSKYTINANGALQLAAASEESEATIFTVSDAAYGKWETTVRMGFNPSSRNLSRFYLISNTTNISDSTRGYFVEIGGSSDDLRLYRTDGDQKTEIIDGVDDLLDTSSVNVRLMISRDVDGNWELWADSTGGVNFQLMGKGHDQTYLTGAYTGFLSKYTSSRSDRFEYDDIKITKLVPPLKVIDTAFIDSTSLRVEFNRTIYSTDLTTDDFSLDNGKHSISEISFIQSNTAILRFHKPLKSDSYLLSISNFTSVEENKISISVILSGAYKEGDIKINEFMYDPDEGPEYIELINTSKKYLDLSGWVIADLSSRKAYLANSTIINPNSLIALTADTSAIKEVYEPNPHYMMVKSLPSLNNSGDVITIATHEGVIVDSLYYEPKTWKGNGLSLERKSVSAPSVYSENWGESTSEIGGSPALPNTVILDSKPPVLENISSLNSSALELQFSERIDSISASRLYNYSITPKIDIQHISTEKEVITLHLSNTMTSGQEYAITIDGLSDIFENQIETTSKAYEYLEIKKAAVGDIVINEFSFNPGSDGDPDFVELYNTSANNIDIANWQIGDTKGKTEISESYILKSGHFLILSGSKSFSNTFTNAFFIDNFPSLNNSSGDAIYISDSSGFMIDSLYYSSNWGQPGYAMERKDPRASSSDSSNWKMNKTYFRNSAGKQNEHFLVDSTPPRAIFATVIDGRSLQIQFSEFIHNPEKSQFILNGRALSILDFNPNKADRIIFSASVEKPKSSHISIQNLSDVKGNTTSYNEIPLSFPPKPGSVVINEIMFNPIANPEDGIPDQSEYIEIRNREAFAVSIEGIILHGKPDENRKINKLRPVSSVGKWLAPGGLMLIYADEKPSLNGSRIAKFFEIDNGNHHLSLRINRNSLGLASSEDAIYLADNTGTVIDSVYYDKSWHNPNITDSRGIALERISAIGSGNDPSNWGSSVNRKGGTPLMENSISQEHSNANLSDGVTLINNPFTPDDDGHNDRLLINYKLDQPDYLIRVNIYDRYGRLVKKLADGKPAGFEGQLIWDGRKDSGGRNRIGIYIIVFEAFNSASAPNKAFKKTAVLARRLS